MKTQTMKVVLLMEVDPAFGNHLTLAEIESQIMTWSVKSISFDVHTDSLPIISLGVPACAR